MESKFGYDFSNVIIHTDEKASKSANSMNALAYTLRNDIFFGQGQYQPNTLRGRRLLAHELTHVVQQLHAHENRLDQSNEKRSLFPIAVQSAESLVLQRQPAEKSPTKAADDIDVKNFDEDKKFDENNFSGYHWHQVGSTFNFKPNIFVLRPSLERIPRLIEISWL